MGRPKAPCGTDAAYRRHLREGIEVDESCRRAHAEAGRKSSGRKSPRADKTTEFEPASEAPSSDDVEQPDDMKLIVDTLRTAFKSVALDDPTRLAPLSREFRAALEAARGPAETPKELTLADQLAQVRAARAARTASKGATA